MISKIEGHKLEKFIEKIGPIKQNLDDKMRSMVNSVLQKFNDGYPSTTLLSDIESTLHLLLYFSLPMSYNKYD